MCPHSKIRGPKSDAVPMPCTAVKHINLVVRRVPPAVGFAVGEIVFCFGKPHGRADEAAEANERRNTVPLACINANTPGNKAGGGVGGVGEGVGDGLGDDVGAAVHLVARSF